MSELIELLRRFPQDARVESWRDIDIVTDVSYDEYSMFPVGMDDDDLPDWNKPDISKQKR